MDGVKEVPHALVAPGLKPSWNNLLFLACVAGVPRRLLRGTSGLVPQLFGETVIDSLGQVRP